MITHSTRTPAAVALSVLGALASAAAADGPATVPANAPAATVDNPQYGLWAKFNPGSSATLVGDMDAGPTGKVHVEVTQTLKAVTPDAVSLSQTSRLTLNGTPRPGGPAVPQTVPAKQAKADMTQTGTADVQAMGQTFACRVFHVASGGRGVAPQGTAYVADGVPGGVVKLVLAGPDGKSLTFLLSAADAK